MTRNIYLLRHAQSADKQTGQSDIDRELTTQGESDVLQLANFLKKSNIHFDRIISSTATRAKATTLLLCQSLRYDTHTIVWDEYLYETSGPQILQRIVHLENSFRNVLFVGHNPSISQVVEILASAEHTHLPPAGMACIAFEDSWNEISRNEGKLIDVWDPKNFH